MEVHVKFSFNTELNELRKIICLKNSEVYDKKEQFQMSLKLYEHCIHCLPCSCKNDVIDILS